MATQWSPSTDHLAVGVDLTTSPSTITAATTQVVLTWQIYARTDSGYWFNNVTWSTSGAVSTAATNYHQDGTPANATVLVGTVTKTVPLVYGQAQPQTLTASLYWPNTGGRPSTSLAYTVPARPPQIPAAATGAAATFNSDRQVTARWTLPASATQDANRWAQTMVQRQTVGSSAWQTVATLTGAASSWVDNSTAANSAYTYRVAGKNATGAGPWATAASVATTPAAPSSVVATRSGNNIVVTWTDNSPAEDGFTIQDGTTTIATKVTGTTYTVANASTSAVHQYRVQATAGALASAWSTYSNPVQLLSAPATPTDLRPAASPTGDRLVLTWRHNPTDTTAQTAYNLRYSTDGGATWTDRGTTAANTSSWDASALASGAGTIRWQVRTQGQYAGASPWSPWSAVQVTNVATRPTVTIASPAATDTVRTSSVEVDWSYYQAEGNRQSWWEVRVLDVTGGGAPQLIERASGNDDRAAYTTRQILANGGRYVAVVNVQDTTGLAASASLAMPVEYASPLPPIVTLEPHLDRGFVEIGAVAQSDGVAPEAVTLNVERQIDDGPWETIGTDLGTSVDVIDWTAAVGGINTYRVTAVSALPSTSQTTAAVDRLAAGVTDCTVLISGGPGFAQTIRFLATKEATLTVGRERTLHQFAGRVMPVEEFGIQVARSVAVSANLLTASTDPADATRDSLEAMFALPGPHLYRDSLGRRMFCSLSSVSIPAGWNGAISFTATEADPGTADQRDTIAAYTGPAVVEITPGVFVIVGGDTLETATGEYVWSGRGVVADGS